MTRNDLHQNLNLHVNSIVRAENAKNISLFTLFEIVDTLDLNLKDLFWDIEKEPYSKVFEIGRIILTS